MTANLIDPLSGRSMLMRTVVTYVMCSRTSTARRLLEALNRLMAGHAGRPWEKPYLELLDIEERAALARLISAHPADGEQSVHDNFVILAHAICRW
ncbi:MAG: hypothetical protein K2W93_03590 [Burkholderiaceae bacterium]|nr:hypothetical protein [Burkholderiaceae bacterium]